MGRVRTLIALSAVLVVVALATLLVAVDGSPAPAGRATSPVATTPAAETTTTTSRVNP